MFTPSLTTHNHQFTPLRFLEVDFITTTFWDTLEVGFLDLDLGIFFVLTTWVGGGGTLPTSIAVVEMEEEGGLEEEIGLVPLCWEAINTWRMGG